MAQTGTDPEFVYQGADNLEVMLEAVNYNRFLKESVLRHKVGTGPMLDFGAGLGTFSEMIRAEGHDVHCLEPDADLSAGLRAQDFTTFQGSEDLPDESYDYIYSLNVFEHIEDDHAAAREATRLLRPGGVLFIYVPAFQVLFGSMDRKVEHFRRYTRKSLDEMILGAGLSDRRTRYADIMGFFATLVYNAISKGDGSINTGSVKFFDRVVFPVSRALDTVTSGFIGKNAYVIARKSGRAE